MTNDLEYNSERSKLIIPEYGRHIQKMVEHAVTIEDDAERNKVVKSIRAKAKYSGCTVHYVTSKIDSGKIILQKKVKILNKDNTESLSKKILVEEHMIYPKALQKIAKKILEKKS